MTQSTFSVDRKKDLKLTSDANAVAECNCKLQPTGTH